MLNDDVLVHSANFLPLSSLSTCLCTCKHWHYLLNKSAHLWEYLCNIKWKNWKYVVPSLLELSKGEKYLENKSVREREKLRSMKIKSLKQLILNEKIKIHPGQLVEKIDFVNAIMNARKFHSDSSATDVMKLLHCPLLLRGGVVIGVLKECYAKCALRLSLQDRKRTVISKIELCSRKFEMRTRNDGPLSNMNQFDPWYSNDCSERGTAKFSMNGTVEFCWPEGYNPFALMGMPRQMSFRWKFEYGNRIVRLIMPPSDVDGPQEIVSRHPIHGGWILYSQGTIWTQYSHPKRSANGQCSDPYLCEENLKSLPSDVERHY